jgi:hypothetical protein
MHTLINANQSRIRGCLENIVPPAYGVLVTLLVLLAFNQGFGGPARTDGAKLSERYRRPDHECSRQHRDIRPELIVSPPAHIVSQDRFSPVTTRG